MIDRLEEARFEVYRPEMGLAVLAIVLSTLSITWLKKVGGFQAIVFREGKNLRILCSEGILFCVKMQLVC